VILDAFLFLQRSDIAHYVASRPAFGDIPHLFIDPGLIEEAVKAGIDPKRFSYRPLKVGAHFQAGVGAQARARASLLDQALTRLRLRLFGPGIFQGWDEGTSWLFFERALVAQRLGELCDEQLPERRIGLFRPSATQRYYFDSFLSTDLFIGHSERWRIVDHYDRVGPAVGDSTGEIYDFTRIAAMARAGQAEAITHIPTCYANHARFQHEITRHHASNIDLPSPMWDLPVRRTTPMSVRLEHLPQEQIPASARLYRDEARATIEQHLAPLVPARGPLQRQAASLADQCLVQAINHHGLLDALRGTCPHFILSDHDTGSHGPLFSVAAALDAPITVLPHSSHPVFALPHGRRVHAVRRIGFGTLVRTVLGEPVRTTDVDLGRAPQPLQRHAARTVCLLVNALHGQGLSYIDLAGLTAFYRALAELCAQVGARLIVRLKPNAAGVMMVSSAFDLPAAALEEVLRWPLDRVAEASDICINYGEATTGGIEFLYSASYLLCASEQHWPSHHVVSPGFVSNGLVESLDGQQALAEVGALLASPTAYTERLQAQQHRFVASLGAPSPIFSL
jgi:hypothetical protein